MKPPLKFLLKMGLFYTIFLISTLNAFAQTWDQIIKLTAKNNGGSSARSSDDFYGRSVSISGDYAIVGAHFEDHDANGANSVLNAGAAYILFNDAGNWVQVKKIIAPVRETFDEFGLSVSISGDYAIVGAYAENEDAQETNTLDNSGSAYIFKKDQGGANNWGLVKKITAPVRETEDRFGYAVSISGDYAIVGAYGEDDDAAETNTVEDSGSAYIFKKDQGGADNWGQVQKIVASTRGVQDRFGNSVSIGGDYAIVGDPFEEEIDVPEANTLSTSGSAFIFKKDQGGADNWGQVKKITAPVRTPGDNFGNKVAISGDYAVVGAPYETEDALETNTLYSSGSAYIFKKDQGGADNWGQVKKITASIRAAEDFFGFSVSISGEYVIVGASGEDQDADEMNTLTASGSAYIFKKDQGGSDNWGQVHKITASVRATNDTFGTSVAIGGDNAIVGAQSEDEDELETNTLANAGSAYIFHLGPPLPVTLITFEAIQNESHALLSWTTTMESNSDYFDIQKSGNGRNWKTMGRVGAAVTSDGLRNYSFLDLNALDGIFPAVESLYRLKMVDLNGSFAYSKVVSLRFDNDRRSMLYPNPVSDKLFFNPADVGKIASVTMTSMTGRVEYRSFQNAGAGISVRHLAPGIYLVKIMHKAGTVQYQRVIVVR